MSASKSEHVEVAEVSHAINSIHETAAAWKSAHPFEASQEGVSQGLVDQLLPLLTTTGRDDYFAFLQGEVSAMPPQGDVTPNLIESSSLINMDEFRADPRFSGIDGRGFSVVVLDTGIDLNHPFFGPDADGNGAADRVVYSYDFSGGDDPDASDTDGHGTHVSSIAASSDPSYPGMAPGANIIQLKVFPDGENPRAFETDIEQALQWTVANAAEFNIASVNLSLGSGNFSSSWTTSSSDEFAALKALEILSVASAGNLFYSEGSVPGIGKFAADPNVLAVGAVYDADVGPRSYQDGAEAYSTAPDRIVPFSQRHAQLLDVVAPGARITAADLSGGIATWSGTSQAAPHIAGIVALAQQLSEQTLGRRLNYDEFRNVLRSSGVIVHDGDDEVDNVVNTGLNFPRVDVLALGNAILNMRPASIRGHVFNDVNGDGELDDGDGEPDGGESGLFGWSVFLDENRNGIRDVGASAASSAPVVIRDLSTVRSTIDVVGAPASISDVDVTLNITHSFDGDLDIFLVSPQGTRVELLSDVGGEGNDFTGTILDDEADTSITSGQAPFSGRFRPESPLSRIDGESANGLWTLEVTDDLPSDSGRIDSWTLTFGRAEPTTTTSAAGEYEFGDLPAGTHDVRVEVRADWSPTVPLPALRSVEVSPGESIDGANFGFQLPTSDPGELPRMLVDIRAGATASNPAEFTSVGEDVFFTAMREDGHRAVWRTNGTRGGTVRVSASNSAANTALANVTSEMVAFADGLMFVGDDGIHGAELWTTDGTPSGTRLVKDIQSGSGGAFAGPAIAVGQFTVVGSTVFFTANDGMHGMELWRTDGTSEGTTVVADLTPDHFFFGPSGLAAANGRLFFHVPAGGEQEALYVVDSAPNSVPRRLHQFTGTLYTPIILGDVAYFAAADPQHGTELWRSDGSDAGTFMVRDIRPGADSSEIESLTKSGNAVYFVANDGVHDRELWTTDGTSAGTRLVADLQEPINFDGSNPRDITDVNGQLYFTATVADIGSELWISDGTEAGTRLVRDIRPGDNSSSPQELTSVDGRLYFVADDGEHVRALWRSDGTDAGTLVVADMWLGSYDASPSHLLPANGGLYFSADDGVHGREPWELWLGLPGDADSDDDVDLDDLNAVRNNFGNQGSPPISGDTYPYDDDVDLDDLNNVRNHFGRKRPVETAGSVDVMVARVPDGVDHAVDQRVVSLLTSDVLARSRHAKNFNSVTAGAADALFASFAQRSDAVNPWHGRKHFARRSRDV